MFRETESEVDLTLVEQQTVAFFVVGIAGRGLAHSEIEAFYHGSRRPPFGDMTKWGVFQVLSKERDGVCRGRVVAFDGDYGVVHSLADGGGAFGVDRFLTGSHGLTVEKVACSDLLIASLSARKC